MRNLKKTLIFSIFIAGSLVAGAQQQYFDVKETDCTCCGILDAVDHQFNAVRNDIELPVKYKGNDIKWEMNSVFGGDNKYTSFDGRKLSVHSLPKGEYLKVGTLTAETGNEKVTFDVTLAPDDEKYGYLYCHMDNSSENTLYALGMEKDGNIDFHTLLNNQPIYNSEDIAAIEGGVRDAFIFRGQNGEYLMMTTDMSNRKSRTWFNHGMNLLKSYDLIHWTSTTIDFRKGKESFSNPDGKDWFKDYSLINRVWAPQAIWDADYDNGKGGYFVYYSLLSTNPGDDHDRIFYSYADKHFNSLTKPQLFYDRGIATIDCHIDWNDCDKKYHIFYKKEGAAGVDRGIYVAVFDKLGQDQWKDILHITNEGSNQVEGPSAFRMINQNKWKVGYIRYSGGKAYKLCNAKADLSDIDRGEEIGSGDVHPQHGSFMTLTKDEYELLQLWSDLKLKVAELEKTKPNSSKVKKAKAVLDVQFKNNPITSLTTLYRKTLKSL